MRRNEKGQLVEERIHPDNYMFARHFFAYEEAIRLVSGDSFVIEAGSGDGYGSNHLAGAAGRVVGIDIEWEPVREAYRRYRRPNLYFIQGSVFEIPIRSKIADFVCTMQVIEHLEEPTPYLFELQRIMKDDAVLFLTTPFRDSKSWRFDKIPSPFHVVEYSGEELNELLSRVFSSVTVKGIRFKESSSAAVSDRQLGMVQSFDKLNVRKLIPPFVKPFIYRLFDFRPIGEIRMCPSDFEIVEQVSDEVMDLVAICRK